MEGGSSTTSKLEKSYFDVLGICCPSEVPLIEKLLKPLEGVKDVSVIVATKTVIVLHDPLVISQIQIVKALNQSRLEANVKVKGESNYRNKWPNPFAVACGVLLLLSFLKYVFPPFKWLAIVAVAVGIVPIIMRAVASLRNFYIIDTNVLMLIAVAGSIVLKDYWEAGTIVFLFTTAEWLESRASHKATAAMSSLMNIAPQRAVLAETGEEVKANEVMINTKISVKAGEIIPIDGTVVEGKCEVDEKALTGESFPVSKDVDSTVLAGSINLNGYISVKTTALAEDCVVAKMAKLVEEAQNNKSKTQRYIDKCSKYYTPAVVVIAISLAAVPAAMRLHNRNKWYHLALVVLVSACPCALILSTPVATFCALSKAAATGLLVKGAEYLETLSNVKIICFDKTGTITRGEFSVSNFRTLAEDISLDKLLYWVSSIESKSSHPMAAALIDYAESHSVKPQPDNVEGFENFPGEGIYGKIQGKDVYVGNQKIATRAGCSTVPRIEDGSIEGKSIGYIFLGSSPAGLFSLSDTCRTGVKEALEELKSMGIKVAMLTGDCQAAANHARNQLGGALDAVYAEQLPEGKAEIIREFQKESPTAMVGDGINDAPALAIADIGISMGISGSALATETGHVILMSNDIRKIPVAVRLARRTRRKIFENIFLAMATKAAVIALAIAGHPLVWAAVLADVGTCLLVILNSMLILRGTTASRSTKRHSSSSHCHSKCSSGSNVNCSSKSCSEVEKKHGCCGQNNKVSEPKHSHEDNVHEMNHLVQGTEGNNGCCGHDDHLHVVKHCRQGTEDEHGCCAHADDDDQVHFEKESLDGAESKHDCCAHSDDDVHEESQHGCCVHVHEVKHSVEESKPDCCADHDHEDDVEDEEIHEVKHEGTKHGCCAHIDEAIHEVKHAVQGSECKIIDKDLESQAIQKYSCGTSVKTQVDCKKTVAQKPHCHSDHQTTNHTHSDSHCKGSHHRHHHHHHHGLERRRMGTCCESFRKECCVQKKFGVGFNGGGLAEIVIE